ncbi:Replication protein A 70 kDa DNA-binding subunit B [Bienertia sinuspersici]
MIWALGKFHTNLEKCLLDQVLLMYAKYLKLFNQLLSFLYRTEITMTKKYKYLDELTDKTKDYKARVKVIEKSRPKQSPGKPARQPLVLRDEKGTTMRGIIFGSDIPLFEQAIVRDGEYEFGDAIIAPVAEQYRQKEKEFQMTFTRRMELIPVVGESSNPGPKYLQIQSIPRTGEASNDLIDVIGLVLYVGDIRPVNIAGREVPVRDIMIVDDRAKVNKTLLDDLRSMILTARDPSQPRVISTLAEIKAKKAANTWLEQKYWIKVAVVDPKVEDMHFYVGCSKCGRKGTAEKGTAYYCNHCKNAETLSVPRVTFKINVSDGTGTHEFTVFTSEVQTLTGFSADQMHEYFSSGDYTQLTQQLNKLATRDIYLQIGPTATIASNRMLSWVIRQISFE